MNPFIKEKSKLSPSSPENMQFYLYLAMPLLLGILLGDGLGIDISQSAARYIGLLRFIQSAGIDIRTKSIIIVFYIIFAPCYWYYFFKYGKQANNLKSKTVTDILILIVLSLIMFLLAYVVIIIGLHEGVLNTPSRSIRFLLACSRWNISFAIYTGIIVWVGIACICGPLLGINELLLRLKNQSNYMK